MYLSLIFSWTMHLEHWRNQTYERYSTFKLYTHFILPSSSSTALCHCSLNESELYGRSCQHLINHVTQPLSPIPLL